MTGGHTLGRPRSGDDGTVLEIEELRLLEEPMLGEPMIESETDLAKNIAVARAVIYRVRAATRGQIRGLEVECDGEVVTIRGVVDNSQLKELAFKAAWIEARNADGLLFDLQVEVVPPPESEGVSPP
jgi:hypothetical protein